MQWVYGLAHGAVSYDILFFFFSKFIYNIWWCPRASSLGRSGLIEVNWLTWSTGWVCNSPSWSLESIGYLSYPLLYKVYFLLPSDRAKPLGCLSRFGLGRCAPATSWQSRLMGTSCRNGVGRQRAPWPTRRGWSSTQSFLVVHFFIAALSNIQQLQSFWFELNLSSPRGVRLFSPPEADRRYLTIRYRQSLTDL